MTKLCGGRGAGDDLEVAEEQLRTRPARSRVCLPRPVCAWAAKGGG